MGAIGRHGQIAAGELVRALRAGLDARELVRNGEVDGLVVADLEMQAGVLLERAPIAAIERVGADEVQRPGDGAALALGKHEQDLIAHGLADQAEELPREIGRAPFARAGIHVEGEEGVPMGLGEIGARDPLDLDPAFERPLALGANGLPLA